MEKEIKFKNGDFNIILKQSFNENLKEMVKNPKVLSIKGFKGSDKKLHLVINNCLINNENICKQIMNYMKEYNSNYWYIVSIFEEIKITKYSRRLYNYIVKKYMYCIRKAV